MNPEDLIQALLNGDLPRETFPEYVKRFQGGPERPTVARQRELENAEAIRSARRASNENPWIMGREVAKLVASFLPGIGEGMDAVDLVSGLREGDRMKATFAGAGLLLPAVGGHALRKVLTKKTAPAVHTADRFRPTERGVFDRSAPKIQGLLPSDPRLRPPDMELTGPKGELIRAMGESKLARQALDEKVDRGLRQGGEEWYEHGPVKAFFDEYGDGSATFEDWSNIGGALSANAPVDNEIAKAALRLFGRKHGLGLTDAYARYYETPSGVLYKGEPGGLNLYSDNWNRAAESADNKILLPEDPKAGDWKTPEYADKRLGGGGLLDVTREGGSPAIDTWERKNLMDVLRSDPALVRLAEKADVDPMATSFPRIRTAGHYHGLGDLYVGSAKRKGLPTAGTAQASTWIDKRGEPGDYIQILEDLLDYNARQLGRGTSSAALRKLFTDVIRGDQPLRPFPDSKGMGILRAARGG